MCCQVKGLFGHATLDQSLDARSPRALGSSDVPDGGHSLMILPSVRAWARPSQSNVEPRTFWRGITVSSMNRLLMEGGSHELAKDNAGGDSATKLIDRITQGAMRAG